MEDFIVDETDEDDDEEEEYIRTLKMKKKKERGTEKMKEGGAVSKRTGGNCICDHCGKGFSTPKYLDSHMTNKHPEKSEINLHIEEQVRIYPLSIFLRYLSRLIKRYL